jgi:hypothetical protein
MARNCTHSPAIAYVWRETDDWVATTALPAVREIADAGRRLSLPPEPDVTAVPEPAFRRTSDDEGRGSTGGCRAVCVRACARAGACARVCV